MAIYEGRRSKTWRVVVWANNRSNEWVFEGSKGEARKFEALRRLELRVGPKNAPRIAPTFSTFCAVDYRPHAEAHLGGDTWKKVRIYQLATLEEHFGPVLLDVISSADVDAFKLKRLETVKPPAINNELRVLRAMLNWGRAVRKLPIADLKIEMQPTRGTRRVHVWTVAEVQKLFAVARKLEPDLLPILVFLVNTGCRKGEALAAEWSWIDRKAELLRIPVTDEWQPKSKKPREVPIGDAVRAALSGEKKSERYVFPNRFGAPYANFPKEAFWRVREAAGLKGGPHTTRHTFASLFLQGGGDLFLLSKLLGHSTTRTTELYAHLLPDHLGRARNVVSVLPKTMAITMAKKKTKTRSSR